jgi:type IX secretion system substrate protein
MRNGILFFSFILFLNEIKISAAQSTFIKRYYVSGAESKIVCMPDSSLYLFARDFSLAGLSVAYINQNGNPQWGKTIQLNYNVDVVRQVKRDANGNWILLLGYNHLLKLDSSFNVLWSKTYTDFTNQFELGFTDFVIMDNDSSCYITGNSDIGFLNPNISLLLLKINSNGNVVWAKYFEALNTWMPTATPTEDVGLCIKKLNDGNLLIGGESSYNDTISFVQNMALFKADAAGNLLWASMIIPNFCTPFCDGEFGILQIEVLPDDSLILAGKYAPYGGSPDNIYIMKADSSGNPAWDYGVSHTQLAGFIYNADSTFYFASHHGGTGPTNPPRIDKLNKSGQLTWSKYYQPQIYFSGLTDIIPSAGVGFIGGGGGALYDPAFILKADSSGSAGCFDFPSGINITGLPNLYRIPPVFTYSPYMLTLIETSVPFTDSIIIFPQYIYCGPSPVQEYLENSFSIYPNPADNEFTISSFQFPVSKIEIVNLLGETVLSQTPSPLEGKSSAGLLSRQMVRIGAGLFPQGIYIIKVNSGKNIFQRKLIVNH